MRVKGKRMGFSLVELLVVVAVFTIIAVISTQALILSLRGSKKSESLGLVRENLDYALAIVERNLHSAADISPCPNTDTSIISYTDRTGVVTTFSCQDVGGDGYIASGSGRLTSDEVNVTACTFTCSSGSVTVPPSVRIAVTAEDANVSGAEGGQVTTDTKVLLRIYQ